MLLTINYKGENTQDIGFLFHKNPSRPQEFEMTYGKAYVFYPEVSNKSTTIALLLDINPLDLARGKEEGEARGLFDYVNDRPYVASSFMSSTIANVFGTALSGKCKEKDELLEEKLDLTAKIHMLPCRGNKELIYKVFEPLGYKIEVQTFLSDEAFKEWGESKYINLTLSNNIRLQDLLKHIYVLIPVFDNQKHYYMGKDEVDKLLRHGESWLKEHPHSKIIIKRYFENKKSYINKVTKQIGEENGSEENKKVSEEKLTLNRERLNAVVNTIKEYNGKKVLDLGCGEGRLIKLLLKDRGIEKITGVDVSISTLDRAKTKLKIHDLPEKIKGKLKIIQSSALYYDKRFLEHDTICLVEVIEHLDLSRLEALENVVFKLVHPKNIIITTPNIEYNVNYINLGENSLRHGDHRFEWTEKEFINWSNTICNKYGYKVEFKYIGEEDKNRKTPTQMGVFTL